METDEMNFEILRNVAKSLKSPAKFIFTALNGLFPLFHSTDDFHEKDTNEVDEHIATHLKSIFHLLSVHF